MIKSEVTSNLVFLTKPCAFFKTRKRQTSVCCLQIFSVLSNRSFLTTSILLGYIVHVFVGLLWNDSGLQNVSTFRTV